MDRRGREGQRPLELTSITSEVLKCSSRSEMNFQANTSGGGVRSSHSMFGMTRNGSGYLFGTNSLNVQPTHMTLSGKTVTIHEYWLKDNSGTEFMIELVESSVRAREGHVLTIAYGSVEGSFNGRPLFIINHNTNKMEYYSSDRGLVRSLYGIVPVKISDAALIWAALAPFGLIFLLYVNLEYRFLSDHFLTILAGLLASPFYLCWVIRERIRRKKIINNSKNAWRLFAQPSRTM